MLLDFAEESRYFKTSQFLIFFYNFRGKNCHGCLLFNYLPVLRSSPRYKEKEQQQQATTKPSKPEETTCQAKLG